MAPSAVPDPAGSGEAAAQCALDGVIGARDRALLSLLQAGARDPAARAFLAFLKDPAAVAIIKRYGYEAR